MKNQPKKFSAGFTLLELLVAMAITTIIVTILVSVTISSLDIWNRSRSQVRSSIQSQAIIQSMAADFESMVVRRGNNFQWLYAKYQIPTDGPKSNSYLSPNASKLIFFSAATDRYNGQIGTTADLGGNISTIAYELKYKDPIGSATDDKLKTFVLYRKIIDPKPTFDNLLAKDDLNLAFNGYATGSNAIDAAENFVCENIYQFSITFHIDLIDPVTTKTRSVQINIGPDNSSTEFTITGNRLNSPPLGGANAALLTALAAGNLTQVEISLTVITDFGITQMRGRTFTPQKLGEFIAKNSYQYSKVIPVPSY